MNEHYRFLQTHDGCPPLTMDFFSIDGTTPVAPDGNGYYAVTDLGAYYIKITDVTTSSTTPVIVGIAPALSDSTTITVYPVGGNKNQLYLQVNQSGTVGQQTHNISLSWNDGTCTRTGTIELKIDVS